MRIQRQILLVQHEDPQTGEIYWVLPGGGREAGESFEQAAVREVWEETGVEVNLVRRLRVPGYVPKVTYALFLAVPTEHRQAAPTVDLRAELYLRAAAWHQVTVKKPLGPLNPAYWGYLERRVRRLLYHATNARSGNILTISEIALLAKTVRT